MFRIKDKLKEIGITLSQVSNKLEISRPTLDAYIEMYENKKIIPKEKYQKVFECLFSEDIKEKEDFIELLDNCHELIEKDRVLGTSELNARKTDIINSTIEEMKRDMKSDTSSEEIYIFINMIIRSYKKEEIFNKLAKYFLTLNGKMDIGLITKDDEVYISNYYKLFYEDKNDLIKVNNKYLEIFYKRVKEIIEKENENKKKLQDELVQKVRVKLDELSKLGVDIDDITIRELLNEIRIED